jgi:hypothetical protein
MKSDGASRKRTKLAPFSLRQKAAVGAILSRSFDPLLFVRDDEFVEAELSFSGFAQAVKQLFQQAAAT